MSEQKKQCPMSFPPIGAGADAANHQCIEGKCAWWVSGDINRCAIWALGYDVVTEIKPSLIMPVGDDTDDDV